VTPSSALQGSKKILIGVAVAAATLGACHRNNEGALLAPKTAELAKQAPDSFRVEFTTSKGKIVVKVYRAWAPNGVDRFYYLAKNHFFDGARFFRAMPGFVVQFGLSGDPRVNDVWDDMRIADDPVKQSNQKGYLTYAMAGPNTRTTQLFINLNDNRRLDAMGFAPIGRVIEGMEAVETLYTGYGDGAPRGRGPEQDKIRKLGEAYLKTDFPLLDRVIKTKVVNK
jgi:peptidyl-prolyl cis-trans isomerase A (cyclophilin A)